MKHYEIILAPTQRKLHIFVGKYDKDFAKEICGIDIGVDESLVGTYVTHNKNVHIESVMWVEGKNNKSTFLHEVVHCTSDIMDHTGITDDEFRAWYTEWLYNTIQDAIKLSK
jgi:hypothetical protein